MPPSTLTARRTTSRTRSARTKTSRSRLMEMGYIVIRFHHKADWKEIFRRHPDIFGASPA